MLKKTEIKRKLIHFYKKNIYDKFKNKVNPLLV